jgi:exoribonuclease II
MFQDNPLLAQLKQQMQQEIPRIQGIVKSHGKGFGFIDVEGDKSYFVPPPAMKKVLHGDHVTARLRTEKGQMLAEPEQLIDTALTRFIGRVSKQMAHWSVIPDHPLLSRAITCHVSSNLTATVEPGDWIGATLQQHPLKGDKGFHAEINEWIAHGDDNFAPWWVALARYQLPRQPPTSEDNYYFDQTEPRDDLTDLPFITIDNEQTQDMDDALAVRVGAEGELTLSIAIADPSAYIPTQSALDHTAYQRGFTHYLPGLDIPMLPRELAEDRCSLRAGERRPALVCQVVIEEDGSLRAGAVFSMAWICSQAKLSYEQVSDWLENQGPWQPPTPVIAEQIRLLQQVANARSEWRRRHATIFKDRPEYRFVLDEQGTVVNIVQESRRTAHRLVEEAMIAANLCAATLLRDQLGYGIFTVHAGLERSQIEQVVSLLKANEATFHAEQLLTLAGFCELRRHLDAQPTPYLAGCLRRYQALSQISCQPAAHFGMGCEIYATWTSPIRKYGDLVNHRLLKSVITQRPPAVRPDAALASHLNERRRQQRVAERQINDWLYARFLQKRMGESSPQKAEIIDVTRGGLRVRLLDNGAVIFLPSASLHPVRAELHCCHEKASVMIKGEIAYRLGDKLTVRLHEVLPETRHVVASPAA